MSKSEYSIINGNKILIVCFGGMQLKFAAELPFEFLNYLSTEYSNICDLFFFVDKDQCWYHKGIKGITKNIDETVLYLDNIIKKGNYKKVIFMGTSAGGYASILFGSLCQNVTNVISFIPQTKLKKPKNLKYADLKNVINNNTNYLLYGDLSIIDKNDNHHISHCENIEHFSNTKIIKAEKCILKTLRDEGYIKKFLDEVIFEY